MGRGKSIAVSNCADFTAGEGVGQDQSPKLFEPTFFMVFLHF